MKYPGLAISGSGNNAVHESVSSFLNSFVLVSTTNDQGSLIWNSGFLRFSMNHKLGNVYTFLSECLQAFMEKDPHVSFRLPFSYLPLEGDLQTQNLKGKFRHR